MKLGDFFAKAPHARPVNPRPVTFTAIARGKVLPGGARNPSVHPVAATVTGAFVLLAGGADTELVRVEARRSLRDRFVDDKDGFPLEIDRDVVDVELTYQILWRVLYEWDAEAKQVGDRLFPEVNVLRETVDIREANRILKAYNAYVGDEHPEVLSDATFRGADEGGEEPPRAAPRR